MKTALCPRTPQNNGRQNNLEIKWIFQNRNLIHRDMIHGEMCPVGLRISVQFSKLTTLAIQTYTRCTEED